MRSKHARVCSWSVGSSSEVSEKHWGQPVWDIAGVSARGLWEVKRPQEAIAWSFENEASVVAVMQNVGYGRCVRPRETHVLEHSILGWWCCLGKEVMETLRSGAVLEGACHWVWALRVHCLLWLIVCPLCFLYVVEMWFASFLLWSPSLPCHCGLNLTP